MVSAYHWIVLAADGTSTDRVSRMGFPTSSDSSSASSSRLARIDSASFSRMILRLAGDMSAQRRSSNEARAAATCDVVVGLARGRGHESPVDEGLVPWLERSGAVDPVGRQAGGHAAYLLIETSSS